MFDTALEAGLQHTCTNSANDFFMLFLTLVWLLFGNCSVSLYLLFKIRIWLHLRAVVAETLRSYTDTKCVICEFIQEAFANSFYVY
jgi:hypothetical protein